METLADAGVSRRFPSFPPFLPGSLSIVRCVLAVVAIGCCASAARAQIYFPLHTAGHFIVDSNGNRVHLNAVNWYGAESTDFVVAGLQSAPLQAIVREIKSLGFNAVRLPWSNQLYESNPKVGSYALAANPALEGENALTILDQVVNALSGAGIMVILDDHNSNAEWCCGNDGNTLWYNSQYPETSWLSDWKGMAGRYLNNPMVIGVDLRNEPRGNATWGGDASTDWHAAAERGGNAVLSVNPHLLIFVEGVNYALDLSGVAALPVHLNVADRLVYEAHDYGFDYSNLAGYSDYVSRITPFWGYLVTGANPAPLWLGEFGTCNSADTCVQSNHAGDNGSWFGFVISYLQANDLDWSYWAINGTESTGAGRTWGAPESYGILNPTWNAVALPALAQALKGITTAGGAGFTLTANGAISVAAPGQKGSSTVTIAPQNGFTGTVNLSCSLTKSPANAVHLPTCTVPASQSIFGNAAAEVPVTISTTGPGFHCVANGTATRTWPPVLLGVAGGGALACLLFLPSLAHECRLLAKLLAVPAVALAIGGCRSGPPPSTTAGSYTFIVTGTAPGLAPVSVQIVVTVGPKLSLHGD